MKVILLRDDKKIGKQGDVVEVKDGHALNYLLPKNIAVEATKENMRKLEIKNKAEKEKQEALLEEAKKLAESLESMRITIRIKAGENGKLFGSVTSKDIADNLEKNYDIKIDKKKIQLSDTIKTTGIHNIEIKLHSEVLCTVKVEVEGI